MKSKKVLGAVAFLNSLNGAIGKKSLGNPDVHIYKHRSVTRYL